MPRRRYPLPSGAHPDDETLPLGTQLTILTRQSTFKQSERNVFSAEMHPDDLIREGQRLGFSDIQVYDWDTGIGAYSTTIADRPALKHWLYELLPEGKSRVLLVSQEDRLFRDKWEDQHNQFIRHVAEHGGWVICGSRVYNFRREFDCEQFRMACKYGRLYIEHHIIRRMLPSLHRAAMSGRYPGGAVAWGYLVDYDRHSSTFMHLVRYEPHAALVVDHLFRRFAALAHPSPTAIARQWDEDGLVFPFFGPDVDERRVRWVDAHCIRDEARGGYPLHFKTVQRILSDVSYLGWRVRGGALACEPDGQPRVCHEPLVDADLFWWCYDRVMRERPAWADGWAPPRPAQVVSSYRPRRARSLARPGEVRFLAAGRVRCVVHGRVVVASTNTLGHVELHCAKEPNFVRVSCAQVFAGPVEEAICRQFVDQLVLDDRDIAALAHVAQQRQTQQGDTALAGLHRQMEEQRRRYDRAKQLVFEAPDLRRDMLDDMRCIRRAMDDLERRIADARVSITPAAQAWQAAGRAGGLAERIRATFLDWPREAQARVLTLALDDALLGWVGRHVLGLWMRWAGGGESRQEIISRKGKAVWWTDEEEAALAECFGLLTWDALRQMFPGRTVAAITQRASRMGLSRPADGGSLAVPPTVFPAPDVENTLAAYGFPLDGLTHSISSRSA